MIRIAICDDTVSELSNIVSIINDYKEQQSEKNIIEYTAFISPLELITAMENGTPYDLVFLDIIMPHMTGMDAAKEIRRFNQAVKIIFLTSSPEYAVDSYSVNAYYYALKPIWKDKLFILLDKVLFEMTDCDRANILIKSKTGLTRVFLDKLEYAEVIGRTINYHLTNGTVIEAIYSMAELEKDLFNMPCFIKPHRSYMINISHIQSLNQKEVKMTSSVTVPLAKANYPSVKAAYVDYTFKDTTY